MCLLQAGFNMTISRCPIPPLNRAKQQCTTTCGRMSFTLKYGWGYLSAKDRTWLKAQNGVTTLRMHVVAKCYGRTMHSFKISVKDVTVYAGVTCMFQFFSKLNKTLLVWKTLWKEHKATCFTPKYYRFRSTGVPITCDDFKSSCIWLKTVVVTVIQRFLHKIFNHNRYL